MSCTIIIIGVEIPLHHPSTTSKENGGSIQSIIDQDSSRLVGESRKEGSLVQYVQFEGEYDGEPLPLICVESLEDLGNGGSSRKEAKIPQVCSWI